MSTPQLSRRALLQRALMTPAAFAGLDALFTAERTDAAAVGGGDLSSALSLLAALFALFYDNMLPRNFAVYGYARSRMSDAPRVWHAPEVREACLNLVRREGGHAFFTNAAWKARRCSSSFQPRKRAAAWQAVAAWMEWLMP